MGKNSKTNKDSSPGRTPGAGRQRQPQPQVVGITPKQPAPAAIPDIQISEDEQGISIQYAPSPITKQAIVQILQWIADKTGVKLPHAIPEPKTHILIILKNIHYIQEQPKKKSFSDDTLVKANEHVLQQLAMTNIDHLQYLLMKEAPEAQQVLPLEGLSKALKEAGAYEKIKKEKNRDVLEAYLTTDKPMGDLRETAGVKSVDAVNRIVHRNLQKIFEYLPPEVQEQYGGSAKEAIKRKASTQLQTRLSKERVKEGLTTKRWEHYREVDKLQGKPAFSEQGLENIRQGRRNTPHEDLSKAAHRRWELYRERQAQSTPTQEPQQPPTQKEHTIIDFTKPPQEH